MITKEDVQHIAHLARIELAPEEEERFVRTVESALIQKLESRDLSLDVDFLKGVSISDLNLLKVFWVRITERLAPIRLHAMTLARDKRTRTTLTTD